MAGQPGQAALHVLRSATSSKVRGIRVTLLLAGIFAMSIADLCLTLIWTTSVGMYESNPLARLVMDYKCPWMLGVWKIASLALALGILYRARRFPIAEFAGWFCFFVMVWLSFRWAAYNDAMSALTPSIASIQCAEDARFVAITE